MDKGIKEREFTIGDQVLLPRTSLKLKWLDGIVTEETGLVSYKVLVGDHLWKHHLDQILKLTNKSYV